MAWRWPGNKPASEPLMLRLSTHICVTWPQSVDSLAPGRFGRIFNYAIFKHYTISMVYYYSILKMAWLLVLRAWAPLTPWPQGNLNEILAMLFFKQILVIDGWGISHEIALILMSLDFTDDQSTLVQVMAWCHQAASHYLSQCWPRSLLPYVVTGPQWVY